MGLIQNRQKAKDPEEAPFKITEVELIAQEFCLQKTEIHQLYKCFTKFIQSHQPYITLDDIAQQLHHKLQNFSELPYLQRLYSLITKKTPGKLFFEQYLTGISAFCLMNSEAILQFVFDWLDSDEDERITIEDIISAAEYLHPKTQRELFFSNFIPQIERLRKKSDQKYITFDDFRQKSNKIMFLVWPAYQLQERMRKINLGSDFWRKQYLKIEKSELLLKNCQKKANRMLQKIKQLKNLKIKEKSPLSIRNAFLQRKKGVASTDMQLVQQNMRIMRRSCPYIKRELANESKMLLQQQK